MPRSTKGFRSDTYAIVLASRLATHGGTAGTSTDAIDTLGADTRTDRASWASAQPSGGAVRASAPDGDAAQPGALVAGPAAPAASAMGAEASESDAAVHAAYSVPAAGPKAAGGDARGTGAFALVAIAARTSEAGAEEACEATETRTMSASS
jgi:hypothetical protein